MRIIQNENVLVVGSKDGKLSIYQFRLAGGLKVDFVSYAAVAMDGLIGFDIIRKDFILFSENGNIKVFDFSLGSPAIESKIKDKAITDFIIVGQQKGYVALTVAKGDRDLKIWTVDREKGNVKTDKLVCGIRHPSLNHNSMFVWS